MRVVVVGSSNTDLVIHAPRLPQPGETILGGEFRQYAGGKGANQAVAAARAGAEVTFIGAHGDDAFGAAAKRALRAEGINVRYFCAKPSASSGVALILVGGRGKENLIAVARSANDELSPADIAAAEPAIRRADIVVAQLEIPVSTVLAAAHLAKKHRVPFVLNPAPARKLPKKLFQLIHTLLPNETEAAMLAESDDVAHNASALLQRGCSNVIVTLGSKGALVATEGDQHTIRARKVKALDSVGAGDCFTGWYAVGIASGADIHTAASRAARAAAICVTRPGAQAAMPFAREVD
jgi:ribokinase